MSNSKMPLTARYILCSTPYNASNYLLVSEMCLTIIPVLTVLHDLCVIIVNYLFHVLGYIFCTSYIATYIVLFINEKTRTKQNKTKKVSACYSVNVCTCIIKLYIFTKDEYTEKVSLAFRGFSSALSGCLGSPIQTPMGVPFTVRSLAFVPLISPLSKGFSSPKMNSFWPMYRKHMWQSHVEIEVYSIAYFDRFAALEVPYH